MLEKAGRMRKYQVCTVCTRKLSYCACCACCAFAAWCKPDSLISPDLTYTITHINTAVSVVCGVSRIVFHESCVNV
jgi:hypothetical protein